MWLTSALWILHPRLRVYPLQGSTPVFGRALQSWQLTNGIMVFWQNLPDCLHKREKPPQFFSCYLPPTSVLLPSNPPILQCYPASPFAPFFFTCYLSPQRSCLGLPPQRHIALCLLFKLFIKERGRQERNCHSQWFCYVTSISLHFSPAKLSFRARFVNRYAQCAGLWNMWKRDDI